MKPSSISGCVRKAALGGTYLFCKKSSTALRLFLVYLFLHSPAWSITATVEPTLTMDPNGLTPLAGVVQLTTDVPSRITINISNGIDSWTREFAAYENQHYLPVLGLKAGNTYSIEIIATDEDNNQLTIDSPLQAVTDPLPDDFPNIDVLVSEPARMEPGYTLISKFIRKAYGTPADQTPDSTLTSYSIILDSSGNVVWYSIIGSLNMIQVSNGNLKYRSGTQFVEFDLLGNPIVSTPLQINAPYNGLTHDIFAEASGRILSLTRERIEVDDYPSSYVDPDAPRQHVIIEDNPVVEFSSDGSFLSSWRLTDLIDPTRIAYGSLLLSAGPSVTYDWAHANAVVHDPTDDSIIVSMRHQDAVIKFSRVTGQLKWILGNHSNWPAEFQPFLLTPVNEPFEWQYHQHAPEITQSGNILLFDNGNLRASPFDGNSRQSPMESYSRAVEYAIDEQSMEVQQVWEYGSQIDQRYFSPSRGDADSMDETGNVLITYADTQYVGGASSESLGMGASHIRIVEVEHSSQADKVFEAAIYNSTPQSLVIDYRSERIPDLYATDKDSDGVPDYRDNCIDNANGPLIPDAGGNSQLDTDSDGFGNICDTDLNNDGETNSLDLGIMKLAFLVQDTQPGFYSDADLNGDGQVNSLDLGILKTHFTLPPGPSSTMPN